MKGRQREIKRRESTERRGRGGGLEKKFVFFLFSHVVLTENQIIFTKNVFLEQEKQKKKKKKKKIMRTKPFLFCFLYLYICKSKKNINFQVQIFTQGKARDDKPFPTPSLFFPSFSCPFNKKKKQLRDALRGGTRAITFDYKNNEKEKKKKNATRNAKQSFWAFYPRNTDAPAAVFAFFLSPFYFSQFVVVFFKSNPTLLFPSPFYSAETFSPKGSKTPAKEFAINRLCSCIEDSLIPSETKTFPNFFFERRGKLYDNNNKEKKSADGLKYFFSFF